LMRLGDEPELRSHDARQYQHLRAAPYFSRLACRERGKIGIVRRAKIGTQARRMRTARERLEYGRVSGVKWPVLVAHGAGQPRRAMT
jgi:hypothetical protein